MTLYMADAYSPAVPPWQVKAAGYAGRSFYLSHDSGKNAQRQYLQAAHDYGLIVECNFEDAATNALGGYSQGQRDGAFSRDVAIACGYPAGCLIPLSCDFDAQSWQYPTVVGYYQGAISEQGPYRMTEYGSYFVVEMLYAALGLYGWQTEAWSYGRQSPHAYALQNGFGREFDTSILEFNVPLWGLTPTPTKPVMPRSLTVSKEDVMAGNPAVLIVTAKGNTAGRGRNQVVKGNIFSISANTKMSVSLAVGVSMANQYGQQPLPGTQHALEWECSDLVKIPNA